MTTNLRLAGASLRPPRPAVAAPARPTINSGAHRASVVSCSCLSNQKLWHRAVARPVHCKKSTPSRHVSNGFSDSDTAASRVDWYPEGEIGTLWGRSVPVGFRAVDCHKLGNGVTGQDSRGVLYLDARSCQKDHRKRQEKKTGSCQIAMFVLYCCKSNHCRECKETRSSNTGNTNCTCAVSYR